MPFSVPAFRASLLEDVHARLRGAAMKIPPLVALQYLPVWQSSKQTCTAQGSVNAISLDLLTQKANTRVKEAARQQENPSLLPAGLGHVCWLGNGAAAWHIGK